MWWHYATDPLRYFHFFLRHFNSLSRACGLVTRFRQVQPTTLKHHFLFPIPESSVSSINTISCFYTVKKHRLRMFVFFFSSHWQDRIWTFFLRSRRLSLSFIFRTRVLFINYRGHRSFWPNFLVKIRFAWSSHYKNFFSI